MLNETDDETLVRRARESIDICQQREKREIASKDIIRAEITAALARTGITGYGLTKLVKGKVSRSCVYKYPVWQAGADRTGPVGNPGRAAGRKGEAMTYQIQREVLSVNGNQFWEVEAQSAEDAVAKFKRGLGKFLCEEIEVTKIGDPIATEVPGRGAR